MSPIYRLYFDVVRKILIPRKECRSETSYLNLILMELLDSEIPINLSSLIIKHMQWVLIQDTNGHALPHGFRLASILEAYSIPMQVCAMQITKDVLGTINHVALPISMQCVDIAVRCLEVALAAKNLSWLLLTKILLKNDALFSLGYLIWKPHYRKSVLNLLQQSTSSLNCFLLTLLPPDFFNHSLSVLLFWGMCFGNFSFCSAGSFVVIPCFFCLSFVCTL